MLSKVHGNPVDIPDRKPLQNQTTVVNPAFQHSQALLNTLVVAPGPGFIMNISNQPVGQLLVWGLVFVRILQITKQYFLSTDD